MAAASSSAVRHEEHAWLPAGHAPFAGKYSVERILGQGGMGVVFEARHIRLGQRVAIKVLGSELREYPELVQRFEREARACGSLTSSHAVRVFDIDATEDGTPFIVMELLAGRDLACIIEREGPQPVARSVRWLIEACDAIAEAHRLGIVHRDIKPSNLFLTDVDGRSLVKVLDFGIAKRVSTQEVAITQAVAPLGTPQYMSPEQVRCAKDVDARTDVWSLGVTLYELVTGQTPFAHESSSACIASIAADPVPDPLTLRSDLPPAFVAVLMKALAKSAKDRYQSVEELVAAIVPFAVADEDEEREEMVSAVRRAFVLSTGPKTPSDQATLDAAVEVNAELLAAPAPSAAAAAAAAASEESGVRPAIREPVESRSDRTVPPAVSRASIAPKRRLRSPLVVASAAVLGLAALVLTPKCVAPPTDSAANAAVHQVVKAPAARAAAAVAAPEPALDVPSAIAAESPAAPAEPVVAPADAPAEVAPATAPRAVAPAQPAVAPAQPARTAKRLDVKPAAPAPLPPPRSGVHGGLSSPGF